MNSVLVTGASGFIGRQTLPILKQQDLCIHAISYGTRNIADDPNIHWHVINLLDSLAIEKLVKKIRPSHLLHLAWYAKPGKFWHDIANVDWVISSLHLLRTFIDYGGKRAVFVGSCAEYDWQEQHFQEKLSRCYPITMYGKAKYALCTLSEEIATQNNLSLAWARLFFLFGTHEYPERIVASVINTLLKGCVFTVKNSQHIRDFMYVNDAADALVNLLNSTCTGPINIASGKPCKIEYLITLIASYLRLDHLIKFENNDQNLPSIITADIHRLQNEVYWLPKYSLLSGINETITWWRNIGE